MNTESSRTEAKLNEFTVMPPEYKPPNEAALAQADLEIPYGALEGELKAIVDEGIKDNLIQAILIAKSTKAMEGLLQFNGYMGELFTETMKRHDVTATRAAGWPSQQIVEQFIQKRRERPFSYLDTLEERVAIRMINVSVRLPKPQQKQFGARNFIMRIFSPDRYKIKAGGSSDDLPLPPPANSTPFGLKG